MEKCLKTMNSFVINEEQQERLEKYIKLLLEWNNKINLIGKSTVDDLWNRHIVDSAQLMKFLSEEELKSCKCADFGTGAGFPGVVLSILGVENMTLIEKSIQKCNFLKEAVKFSNNKIDILNKNINEIKTKKFDVIFSRALASLDELLFMVKPFVKSNTRCIFLKGRKAEEELVEAKKHHNFEYKLFDSETSSEGKVVIVEILL